MLIHQSRALVLTDAAARTMLLASCRPLFALNDARIARIYEADFFQDRPYLVVASVHGRTLLGQKLERARAVALIGELAHGIAAAHRLGLVHGHISPRGIVLDDEGNPRVIDFGVDFLMSPEANRHSAASKAEGPASAADDIASLGALLHGLLTDGSSQSGAGLENSRPPELPRPLSALIARSKAGELEDADSFARSLDRCARPRNWPLLVLATVFLSLLAAFVLWVMLRPH